MKLGPLQQEWVDALRSGQYQQCANKLTDDAGRYCCLGVMELLSEGSVHYGDVPYSAVARRYGLRGVNGPFLTSPEVREYLWVAQESCLAALNDAGWSFTEIADFIEKFPEAIFTESV